MTTISEQLETLNNIKTDIRESITGKGVTVPEGAPFTQYSGYIDDISTGANVNTAQIQKDNVIRTVSSGVQGKVPDVTHYTNVGSVSVSSDYIASGFTGNKYLQLPDTFSPNSNTWDIVVEFTTGSSSNSAGQGIFTGLGSSDSCSPIYIHNNGYFIAFLSSNGTSWDIAYDINLGITVQLNTTYRIKASYTGTSYTWSLWNGTNWNEPFYILENSTPIIGGSNQILGANRGSGNQAYFLGSINLKECYIKINGQLWWEAVTINNWQDL